MNIFKKMLLLGCVSLSVVIISNNAASVPPERKIVDFLNQSGEACPGLDMLRPQIPAIYGVNLVQSPEQGGNSIVYFGKVDGMSSIVKISKKVDRYNENSETQKTIRAIDRIKRLRDPVFNFAIPTKIYEFMSPDRQRVCDVQIAPKVDGQKINSYFYEYVDGQLNATDLFERLGQKLAQFQTRNIDYSDVDFDYGPLHSDFQVGNIFYHDNDRNFTLIDLSDFTLKGKLILDPVYFVYFLPHMWGAPGKSNEQNFRDRYNDGHDNFKERIDSIVTSFLSGYVNNLSEAMASKMYIYFKNNNTPGLSAFGFNAATRGVYGQNLQNVNSQDILEPLMKKAFSKAYEKKYNNVRILQNNIQPFFSPITLDRFALRDAAFEQKDNNKGYFKLPNGKRYLVKEKNNRFLELVEFLHAPFRGSIVISEDGTVSSPHSSERFKIYFEIFSPITLDRFELRDAAFEQKDNNKGYFTRNGNNYIIMEKNNRFLDLVEFLHAPFRGSIVISGDGTVSSPHSSERFKIYFERK